MGGAACTTGGAYFTGMVTLLTWSDRGMSPHPVARPRTAQDVGPILRLVRESESEGRYDQAVILVSEAGAPAAKALAQDRSMSTVR